MSTKIRMVLGGATLLAGVFLFNSPALAADETCNVLEPSICSTLYFTTCVPASPAGPAECTTNRVDVYGRLINEQ